MKAITLYQPHATLMAIWAKHNETRPRSWKHRGPVAIHAGLCQDWLYLCRVEPFKSVLAAAGYHSGRQLPLGSVIAVGNMVDCVSTSTFSKVILSLTPQERAFGNYEPDRFAYAFDSMTKLAKPILWPGHQGMWNLPAVECDGCDGTGLMEGWNRRDGHPCPKCHGDAIVIEKGAA